MRECKICRTKHDRRSQYCSIKCYFRDYYKKHKKEINERRKKYNKEHYIPKPKKLKTEEEKKEYRKKHYQEHKDYYREYHRKYHIEHKNDIDYRRKRKKASKKYIKKRYQEDPEFRKKCKQNWRKNRNGKV